MPILDAFVSSTAVITSNISCLPEIGGNAVYYVDPYSTAEITNALKNLLTCNLTINSYVELGHKRIEKFTLEKIISQTQFIYKKLT